MSSYVVSARKYRPMRFSEVVGQEHVSQTLKNALQQDHLAQAFLFCGPRGVGKTTCARILAKALNCEQLTEEHEPCNSCNSCKAFNENASLNITELDAASNNSVEHIRALIDQVRIPPQQGRYRVFIIDEVHMLSLSAFNAFLKTLEEPPAHVVFILATTEKHKILPTILSRCQIYDFKRIGTADIKKQLSYICEQEGIEAEDQGLHIIAQKADGALRDALSVFDRIVSFSGKKITYQTVIENLHILDYDYYFQFVDLLLSEDVSQLLLLFDEVLRDGFEGDIFLQGLASHLRDLLVCQDAESLSLLEVGENLKERYLEQAQSTPPTFLISALSIATESELQYKQAKNKRLHVEMALIKMCYILRAREVAELVERAGVEKKSPELNSPPPKKQPQSVAGRANSPTEQRKMVGKPTSPSASKPPLSDLPSATSPDHLLSRIDEQVLGERQQSAPKAVPLTTELLQVLWDEYADSTPSDLLRSAMKKARLEYEQDLLVVHVASGMIQANIRQETALMEHLRERSGKPDLRWDIRIDEQEAASMKKKRPKPVKRKNAREKYLEMLQVNPLLETLRKDLDLMPDGEA